MFIFHLQVGQQLIPPGLNGSQVQLQSETIGQTNFQQLKVTRNEKCSPCWSLTCSDPTRPPFPLSAAFTSARKPLVCRGLCLCFAAKLKKKTKNQNPRRGCVSVRGRRGSVPLCGHVSCNSCCVENECERAPHRSTAPRLLSRQHREQLSICQLFHSYLFHWEEVGRIQSSPVCHSLFAECVYAA